MELKHALAVCLITLFSATLVVLIARTLDSQAASRLEPQLARIVEELEAIRIGGGIAVSSAAERSRESRPAHLMVYYFHGNTRCPTCEAIEAQTRSTVESDFAAELASGEMVWKTLNYEESAGSELATKFDIRMPVVVLAQMKAGEVADWKRLDQVWGLVGDQAAFSEFVRVEVRAMLESPSQGDELAQSRNALRNQPDPEP